MSKRGFFSRYLLIIKKLKAKPYATFEEIQDFLENQMEFLQMQDDTLNLAFSKRTFQRDLKEIRNIFGVDIEYSVSEKGYFISFETADNMNFQRLLETFDIFNALQIAENAEPFVHFEKRKPQGTEFFIDFLHAIQHRCLVKFVYQKFWEETPTERLVEPYLLKEFKNRWYILAKEQQGIYLKSFALDRISKVEITTQHFQEIDYELVEENYRYSFGIMSGNPSEAETVILSFDPFQGKYIKSLPLHHSQEILIDHENELVIKCKLILSFDFLMEIMSFGEYVKVLAPESFVLQVKEAHEKALNQYL